MDIGPEERRNSISERDKIGKAERERERGGSRVTLLVGERSHGSTFIVAIIGRIDLRENARLFKLLTGIIINHLSIFLRKMGILIHFQWKSGMEYL